MNLDYSPVFGGGGGKTGGCHLPWSFENVAAGRCRAQGAAERSTAPLLGTLSVRRPRKSHDADAIMAITTKMTGEYLKVAICAYADMDADQDGFTIRGDWERGPGSPSIVGHYSLADFGKLAVRNLGAGRPLGRQRQSARNLRPRRRPPFKVSELPQPSACRWFKEGAD